MEEKEIVEQLKRAEEQIEDIKSEKKCIASPKVKHWRKNVEDAMESAGTHCAKNLQSFRALKFGGPSKAIPIGKNLEDFVNYNNYLMELEAAKKLIEASIRTLKLFGKEEKTMPFDWRKKEVTRAIGDITIGNNTINIKSINILELFICFEKLVYAQKGITQEAKELISDTLAHWRDNPMLSPIFSISLDKALGYLYES